MAFDPVALAVPSLEGKLVELPPGAAMVPFPAGAEALAVCDAAVGALLVVLLEGVGRVELADEDEGAAGAGATREPIAPVTGMSCRRMSRLATLPTWIKRLSGFKAIVA